MTAAYRLSVRRTATIIPKKMRALTSQIPPWQVPNQRISREVRLPLAEMMKEAPEDISIGPNGLLERTLRDASGLSDCKGDGHVTR